MSEREVGGLWCHEVLGLLEAYVDGRLTEAELAAVTAHVGGCDRCERFGASYARVVAALRASREEPAPDHVLTRVESRLWGAS